MQPKKNQIKFQLNMLIHQEIPFIHLLKPLILIDQEKL